MIKVHNISKSYGNIQALDNVSFQIRKGEIFGLLGPNGAGKSTTINILNTLLPPDEGSVQIDGLDIASHRIASKMNIGVVPQEIALYEDLSAMDNLLFWGGLYNIPPSTLQETANKVIELVGLADRKMDPVKTFSGGMKRRVNIACSILHKPKVLLMDEPTVGVDPQSRNYVFEVIEALNQQGMTIIYTTHYMEEAERLCDRIAIIDGGHIVAQGSLLELRNKSKVKDILTLEMVGATPELLQVVVKHIAGSIGDEKTTSILVESDDINSDLTRIIEQVQQAGGVVGSIDTQKANLESVFLKLTGKQLRD